jgi:GTPase SAR1 family protein
MNIGSLLIGSQNVSLGKGQKLERSEVIVGGRKSQVEKPKRFCLHHKSHDQNAQDCCLGDYDVGKTSLISTIVDSGVEKTSLIMKTFNSGSSVSKAAAFFSVNANSPNCQLCLQIWDTADWEQFRSLIPQSL